jgi:hypothetical protein
VQVVGVQPGADEADLALLRGDAFDICPSLSNRRER